MKKLMKFLANLLTIHTVVVVDAFNHKENTLRGIDTEQSYKLFGKLHAMDFRLDDCKVFHATTNYAEASAEDLSCFFPGSKRSLVKMFELDKAHIDITSKGFVDCIGIKSFSRAECEQLIQLFKRHKNIIVIADGYAGIIADAIAQSYDIIGQNNQLGAHNKKLPANNMAIIKYGIGIKSALITSYLPDKQGLHHAS